MNTMSLSVYKAFLIFSILLVSQSAYASVTYTVAPLVIDTKVEARDIITKKITVTNTGDQQVTIYPTVNNISLSEGGTIEAFLPPVSSDRTKSLASWIEIIRLGTDIPPHKSKTFDVTLRINPEPVPSTYHAFIGFGYGRNRDEAETQVKNGQAPGTVVTVTIEEKKNEFLKLSKFIINRFVTSTDNQAAVYTFKNPGDETLIPKGEIILYDSKGSEVGSIPVNEENVSIPPGEEHVFTEQMPIEGKFGKYKAFLTVEYGSVQRASVQDTNFFYVFPLKYILGILFFVCSIVAFSAWYFHKRYFDEDTDDSDRLTFHVRESQSDSKHHDIDLKQS
jgi:hypothetical protein